MMTSYRPSQAAEICRLVAAYGGSAEDCAMWLGDGYPLAEIEGTLIALRRAGGGDRRLESKPANPGLPPDPEPRTAAAAAKTAAKTWAEVQKANRERLGLR